jgi:hypothetical protein
MQRLINVETYSALARTSVPYHIRHRFLNNSVRGNLNSCWQWWEWLRSLNTNLESAVCYCGCLRPKRANQPKIVKRGRAQRVYKPSYISDNVLRGRR